MLRIKAEHFCLYSTYKSIFYAIVGDGAYDVPCVTSSVSLKIRDVVGAVPYKINLHGLYFRPLDRNNVLYTSELVKEVFELFSTGNCNSRLKKCIAVFEIS